MTVLGGEEESAYDVSVDGRQMENISEFKYLGFLLDDLVQIQQNGVKKW